MRDETTMFPNQPRFAVPSPARLDGIYLEPIYSPHVAVKTSSTWSKYLSRYATAEVAFADEVEGSWNHALVVPACGEAATLLSGYTDATRAASGSVLVILVVNATDSASPETHDLNARTLVALRGLYPSATCLATGSAWLHRGEPCDVLWIDRSSEPRRLPPKQGVGLARRIGCDIALSLIYQGKLSSQWIHTTDADVVLPADYFTKTSTCDAKNTSALVHPFRHERGGLSQAQEQAQALYELSLRYYVAGLAYAGSPYAYHSIGSTMSISASSYAAARGMPCRRAGEDFYLLNKLAKLGRIVRLGGDDIRIAGRTSDRVPFGTGRATLRITSQLADGREFTVYNPLCFTLLRVWLDALRVFTSTREWQTTRSYIDDHAGEHSQRLSAALDSIGAPAAIRDAAHRCSTGEALGRRIGEWMDAFRTLKLIHALRDEGLEMISWRAAIQSAPLSLAPPYEPQPVCAALALVEPTVTGLT